jgi:hypothetical protein
MLAKVLGKVAVASFIGLAGTAAVSAADMNVSTTGVYSSSRSLGTRQILGFWGNTFPYGYRWSLVRACERRELVATSRGPRWQRVWVCRVPRDLAYQ